MPSLFTLKDVDLKANAMYGEMVSTIFGLRMENFKAFCGKRKESREDMLILLSQYMDLKEQFPGFVATALQNKSALDFNRESLEESIFKDIAKPDESEDKKFILDNLSLIAEFEEALELQRKNGESTIMVDFPRSGSKNGLKLYFNGKFIDYSEDVDLFKESGLSKEMWAVLKSIYTQGSVSSLFLSNFCILMGNYAQVLDSKGIKRDVVPSFQNHVHIYEDEEKGELVLETVVHGLKVGDQLIPGIVVAQQRFDKNGRYVDRSLNLHATNSFFAQLAKDSVDKLIGESVEDKVTHGIYQACYEEQHAVDPNPLHKHTDLPVLSEGTLETLREVEQLQAEALRSDIIQKKEGILKIISDIEDARLNPKEIGPYGKLKEDLEGCFTDTSDNLKQLQEQYDDFIEILAENFVLDKRQPYSDFFLVAQNKLFEARTKKLLDAVKDLHEMLKDSNENLRKINSLIKKLITINGNKELNPEKKYNEILKECSKYLDLKPDSSFDEVKAKFGSEILIILEKLDEQERNFEQSGSQQKQESQSETSTGLRKLYNAFRKSKDSVNKEYQADLTKTPEQKK